MTDAGLLNVTTTRRPQGGKGAHMPSPHAESSSEMSIVSALYEVFMPLLTNKPQIAAQLAAEIDVIAERYAAQYLMERSRPERYRPAKGNSAE